MWANFSRLFSSIAAKLFLSFWLITIISVSGTSFILKLLQQESVIVPLNKKDAKHLEVVASRLEKRQPKHLRWLNKLVDGIDGYTWLIKKGDSQELLHGKNRYIRNLANYLAKNELSNLTSIQFPNSRLTGPRRIVVNSKSYQLFVVKKNKPSDFGYLFLKIPRWVVIIIPLLISFLFCLLLARYLTRPLIAIQQATTRIGNGDYSTRVPHDKSRNDELGKLTVNFNQMAEKLANNIDAHQRLLADVSHELRTPLTRLQITLGLIEQKNTETKQVCQLVTRCEREVQALDDMIANILTVSRQENGFQALDLSSIKLSNLLTKIQSDNKLIAEQAKVTIVTNYSTNAELTVDNKMILSALNNVLVNAIKYSQPDQQVVINAKVIDANCVIEVIDHGIGANPEHLKKLFQPFYRISDFRDRNTGGTGLGLAIAKQAIDAHDGKISAKNNDAGGLTITLELPISR